MEHLKIIRKYLKQKTALDAIPPTGFPFVTISRQAGAGGHLLAHVILTDFLKEEESSQFDGWHVFDRELCQVVAEDPALCTSMEALLAETYRSEFKEFIEGLFSGRPQQYMELKRTFQVVRILGLLGKVVLVGRAGAFVTRDLPAGIHVRLVASEASRVRWLMRKLAVSRDQAVRLMRKQDAERERLVRTFFDHDIADPEHYDAVFNSDKMDPHEMSYAVIQMIKRRRTPHAP